MGNKTEWAYFTNLTGGERFISVIICLTGMAACVLTAARIWA